MDLNKLNPMAGNSRKTSLVAGALFIAAALLVMWALVLLTWVSEGAVLTYGIIPRTVVGLRGIFLAPFLHASAKHLAANSVPLAVLGWLTLFQASPRRFLAITLTVMFTAGMTAWLIGAGGSIHVGASGVVFGYLGFLLLHGVYTRKPWAVAGSAGVALIWGSIIFGVLPLHEGVSWQAHLGGFAGGVWAAKMMKTKRDGTGV